MRHAFDAATFEVDVIEYPPIDVDLGPDLVLPCNGMQTVFSTVTGGNPGASGYTYSWEDQNGFPLFSWTETALDVGTWMGVTEITLVVEDECGLTGSAMVNVSVDVPELFVDLDASYDVSCNVPFSITPDWSGGSRPSILVGWRAFRSLALTRPWIGPRIPTCWCR